MCQVRDISWDISGCFVATCSDDGSVAVVGRKSGGDSANGGRADEWDLEEEQSHGDPLLSIRLDPRYATRRERVYLTGGEAGDLVRHTRGWFNTLKDAKLDRGDGAISSMAWGAQWVAWSNARGVKIMHGDTSSPVSFVPKPVSDDEDVGCSLFWEDDNDLLLGWGSVVMLIRVKIENQDFLQSSSSFVGSTAGVSVAAAASAADGTLSLVDNARAEVYKVFRLDCTVCGLCPFDADHVAVLAYPPIEEDLGEDAKETGEGYRPEFQVISRDDGSVASAEALPITGYQGLGVEDYSLTSTDEFDWARRSFSWRRGDFALLDETYAAVEPSPSMLGSPPRCYVASPRDVVVARIRDVDDAVDLALSKAPGLAKDALVVASAHAHRLRRHRVQDLVKARLDALLTAGDFKLAASECQRLLGDNQALWEYWVIAFSKYGALAELAPLVPTGERARLPRSVYDMILERLLATNPSALRDVLKRWGHPASTTSSSRRRESPERAIVRDDSRSTMMLYSLDGIALRVEERSRDAKKLPTADRVAIVEARAELHVLDGQAERALTLLLNLGREEQLSDSRVVFDLVESQELYDAVRFRVADLAAFSRPLAASLFVRRADRFPINDVAHQLEKEGKKNNDLLFWYLRVAFSDLPEAYASSDHRELHAKHADLYATVNHYPTKSLQSDDDYDSELMRFLKWSAFVPLQPALEACIAADLHNEAVYILGRIGEGRRALRTLLDNVGSVRRAVDFVEGQGSPKDLWDILISHALEDESYLGGLLDYSEVASRLVSHIPDSVAIPDLKQKLMRIFKDRRFDLQAHETCAKAARADSLDILRQFYARQNRGVKVVLTKRDEDRLDIGATNSESLPPLEIRRLPDFSAKILLPPPAKSSADTENNI